MPVSPVDELRKMILDLEFEPGSHLSEPKLAIMFGVSRTPIREAIKELVKEDLVRFLPGRGAFVTDVSMPELVDLYNMRAALEPYCARLAARTMRHGMPTLLPSIRNSLVEFSTRLNADNKDEFFRITAAFDEEVVRLSRSPRLASSLRQVWDHTYRARKLASTANLDRLQCSISEHLEMIDSIMAGDEERTYAVTLAHTLNGMQSTVSTVEQLGYRVSIAALTA
jgi:DNA-binding GntR family transcriptional regulator